MNVIVKKTVVITLDEDEAKLLREFLGCLSAYGELPDDIAKSKDWLDVSAKLRESVLLDKLFIALSDEGA